MLATTGSQRSASSAPADGAFLADSGCCSSALTQHRHRVVGQDHQDGPECSSRLGDCVNVASDCLSLRFGRYDDYFASATLDIGGEERRQAAPQNRLEKSGSRRSVEFYIVFDETQIANAVAFRRVHARLANETSKIRSCRWHGRSRRALESGGRTAEQQE